MKLMDDPGVREQVAREHITYEVHALWVAALEYATLPKPVTAREGYTKNALLESCLVHARLLAEFLDGKPTKDHEDAHAKHYFASWSATNTLAQTERDWINWKIMHLSAERARLGGGLDLVETAERVLHSLRLFMSGIPDAGVRGWFAGALAECAYFDRERSRLEREGVIVRLVASTSESGVQIIQNTLGEASR